VTFLAEEMTLLPDLKDMPDLLRKTYVPDTIDQELFTHISKILADPSKCLVFLTSKQLNKDTMTLH
jgi:hypothetical protein